MICCLSVGGLSVVYYDKMAEVRICGFYYNVAQCLNCLTVPVDGEIRRGPLERMTQTRVEWFLTSR